MKSTTPAILLLASVVYAYPAANTAAMTADLKATATTVTPMLATEPPKILARWPPLAVDAPNDAVWGSDTRTFPDEKTKVVTVHPNMVVNAYKAYVICKAMNRDIDDRDADPLHSGTNNNHTEMAHKAKMVTVHPEVIAKAQKAREACKAMDDELPEREFGSLRPGAHQDDDKKHLHGVGPGVNTMSAGKHPKHHKGEDEATHAASERRFSPDDNTESVGNHPLHHQDDSEATHAAFDRRFSPDDNAESVDNQPSHHARGTKATHEAVEHLGPLPSITIHGNHWKDHMPHTAVATPSPLERRFSPEGNTESVGNHPKHHSHAAESTHEATSHLSPLDHRAGMLGNRPKHHGANPEHTHKAVEHPPRLRANADPRQHHEGKPEHIHGGVQHHDLPIDSAKPRPKHHDAEPEHSRQAVERGEAAYDATNHASYKSAHRDSGMIGEHKTHEPAEHSHADLPDHMLIKTKVHTHVEPTQAVVERDEGAYDATNYASRKSREHDAELKKDFETLHPHSFTKTETKTHNHVEHKTETHHHAEHKTETHNHAEHKTKPHHVAVHTMA